MFFFLLFSLYIFCNMYSCLRPRMTNPIDILLKRLNMIVHFMWRRRFLFFSCCAWILYFISILLFLFPSFDASYALLLLLLLEGRRATGVLLLYVPDTCFATSSSFNTISKIDFIYLPSSFLFFFVGLSFANVYRYGSIAQERNFYFSSFPYA